MIRAVISDFGGVLTTPLMHSFAAFQDRTGIPTALLGSAMQAIAEADGAHPLFELETGRMSASSSSEPGAALEPLLGHRPEMHLFKEVYFEALDPNQPMIELMRAIKARGYRMALLTNNVREWEPCGARCSRSTRSSSSSSTPPSSACASPIRRSMNSRSSTRDEITAAECLFVDDVLVNIEAARELGMSTVHFRDNAQAIAEVEAALGV